MSSLKKQINPQDDTEDIMANYEDPPASPEYPSQLRLIDDDNSNLEESFPNGAEDYIENSNVNPVQNVMLPKRIFKYT